MNKLAVSLAASAALLAFGAHAAPDWNKAPKRNIQVFFPGVASHEWTMKRASHRGATALGKTETCVGCHEGKDGSVDFDMTRLIGKTLEPVGAPKTMNFPVSVQAAYDADNLYLRLTFKAPTDSAPDASREDNAPHHEVKAAIMFASPLVKHAAQNGCWLTCHENVRSMPGADPKKKKFVEHGELAGGIYYDYIQWKSGEGGEGATQVDGHVASERVNKGGKALIKAEGENKDGAYTVTFTRKLAGNSADGDLTFAPGQVVPFGVAIHTDKTVWRFHHVSLGYTLGIGTQADVKAIKQ